MIPRMSPESKTAEIEITPVMLAAGVRILMGRDERFESSEEVVEQIFLSMINARAALSAGSSKNSQA